MHTLNTISYLILPYLILSLLIAISNSLYNDCSSDYQLGVFHVNMTHNLCSKL